MNRKRFVVFMAGINILVFGIILNARSGMGVSAFTSLYYAGSILFDLSLGFASILMYLALVILQWLVVRTVSKQWLLQIPFSFAVGFLTDLYDLLIPEGVYPFWLCLLFLGLGIICSGIGVYCMIDADLLLTPVDATVKLIAEKKQIPISKAKNYFDGTMVASTIVFSWLVSGTIVGIGTVASALLCGRVVKLIEASLKKNALVKSVKKRRSPLLSEESSPLEKSFR